MDLAREHAAQVLGMKPREVILIEETDGGTLVVTHDGNRTLIDHDGNATPLDADGEPVPAAAAPELHFAGPAPQITPGELAQAGTVATTDVREVAGVLVAHDGDQVPDAGGVTITGDGDGEPLPPITDPTVEQTHPGTGEPVELDDADQVPDAEPGDGGEPVEWSQVPTGNATDVAEWVGDDAERARIALDREHAQPKPRGVLVTKLERIANPA